MTAEFAITLPAIVALIALCVGGIGLATFQLRLTAAAADIARIEARGEGSAAAEATSAARVLAMLGDQVEVTRRTDRGMLCVTLAAQPGAGVLSAIELTGEACALFASD